MDNYVESLHNLLLQSTSNDTAAVKAATAQLNKEYYKNSACIPALAKIVAQSPDQGARQLAAVELRKRVSQNSGDLWIQIPQANRNELKSQLPQLILQESSKLVRNSTARVIAAIAFIEVPLGQWPELLPFLVNTCRSGVVAEREVGVFILFTVLESIVDGFDTNMRTFLELFQQLLNDPQSSDVRITSVRALGVIAQYLDTDDKAEIEAFQSLLPTMITVIGQCVDSSDEVGARQVFDVLETLLILEIPILSQFIPQLAEFLSRWGANKDNELEIRILALNALSWTVQYKKSKIQSNNLAHALLEVLMPITTEPEPEDSDEDAPARSALRIIDKLATTLPPAQVFLPLSHLIKNLFSSTDPNNRRGAMLALGVSVEGCSEFMTPLMPQVWPIIEAGLTDEDVTVKKATCVAISCLCEWLEDECAAKHSVLVPVLLQLANVPATQRSACTALDAVLEILGDNISQYLDPIMTSLATLLSSAPVGIKSVIIGAIGSAAHASKEKFLPYFQQTMVRFQEYLVLTGEGEEQELRGITMDAVGTFAEALGKEAFRPYFVQMMSLAFSGMEEVESARLRECSFLFSGVMARVFEDEFAVYLPRLVPALLKSLRQAEHGDDVVSLNPAEAVASFASGSSPATAIPVPDGVDPSSIDPEELDIDIDKLLDVNSTICIEKEIAADTIGTLFASTHAHFLEHLEPCTLELVGQLTHYYDGIRKSAIDSLLEMVRCFYDLSNPPEWTPGAGTKNYLDPKIKELVAGVVPPLLDLYETEDDKKVVASLCVGLAETINKLGPEFIDGKVDQIAQMAIQILDQKAVCQQDPDQDDTEEAPEDTAEYDSILISSAGDLVASLSTALGPDFAKAFLTFFPLITKYYKKSRSLSDRSSAIGCLSEIIAGMKTGVTPHSEILLDLFYRALNDAEPEVLTNAAFAVGLLVEHSEVDLSSQYLHILTALRPLFDVAPDAPSARLNAKDNATGAVARLIIKKAAALPLGDVLPVFLGALPLKNDYLENRPVFRALFLLFNTNPQALEPHLARILAVFAFVLDPSGPDQLGEELRGELIGLVKALGQAQPQAVQGAGLGVFL